jgi:hypothetical protein
MAQVWCIVEVKDLDKKLDEAERNSAFDDVHKLAAIGEYVNEKIKSFVIEKGGAILMQRPETNIFNVSDNNLEELEYIVYGYEKSLNINLPFGMGLQLNEAKRAVKKSNITHYPEFFHKDDIFYKEEISRDLENLPEKTKKKVQEPVLAPSLEEGEAARQEYINSMAQATMDAATPPPAEEPQPQQEPLQEAAMDGENVQQVPGSIPEETLKPIDTENFQATDDNANQLVPNQSTEGAAEEASVDAELSNGMDQAEEKEEPAYDRLVNLIATIKMHLPEIMKLQTSNPEAFNASMKFINSAIKLTKYAREHGTEKLEKMKIGAAHFQRKFGKLPVGTVKDQKMKIKDASTGRDRWISAKTGILLNDQGEPESVAAHNRNADGKEG